MVKELLIACSCWFMCSGMVSAKESQTKPDVAVSSSSIYGEWKLVGASVAVPVNCRRTLLRISPDGYVSEQSQSAQGELFSFRAQARIKQQGSRFFLTLSSPQHNGKPDCLGNPARYIIRNFLNSVQLQLNGNRLYHYLGDDQPTGYLRYERMPLAGNRSLRP